MILNIISYDMRMLMTHDKNFRKLGIERNFLNFVNDPCQHLATMTTNGDSL
jgi:hypothetical protein